MFNQNDQGDLMGVVRASNISQAPVALKIKTTSPDKYRVRPSMACLAPGKSCAIEIYVQTGQIGPTASLVRDKFLITAVITEDDSLSNQRIGEIMKVHQTYKKLTY